MQTGKRLLAGCLSAALLLISALPVAAADGVNGKCLGVYSTKEAAILLSTKQDNAHILKPNTKYTISFCYLLRDRHTSIKWGCAALPKGADEGPTAYYEWDPNTLEYRWSAEDLNSITADAEWVDDEVRKVTFTFRTTGEESYFRVTNAIGTADAVIDNFTVTAEGHTYEESFESCAKVEDSILLSQAAPSLESRGSAPVEVPTTTTKAPTVSKATTTGAAKTTDSLKTTSVASISETTTGTQTAQVTLSTDETASTGSSEASSPVTESSGESTQAGMGAASSAPGDTVHASALPWILVGIAVVVLAGGGIAVWLTLKKKQQGTRE